MTAAQDTQTRDGTHEPVDAEVVPDEDGGNGHALVHRPTREALTPLDPEQVVAGMDAYQQLLPRLLVASDYQDAGRGRKFVKKSGWRKIARAFNLSVELVSSRVERDEDGQPVRAEVVARAIAPNGQVQDGDGYCSVDEDRFSGPRGNKSKLENDLRATATTRAKNRAIADLVGMGEVSAEEIAAAAGPEFGPHVGDAEKPSRALTYLLDDRDAAAEVWVALKQQFGYMPQCVADAIVAVARKRHGLARATIDPKWAVELQDKLRAANLSAHATVAMFDAAGIKITTRAEAEAKITALSPQQAEALEAELDTGSGS